MDKKSVLIIDDERRQLEALKLALQIRGFEVEAAGTIAEARRLGGQMVDRNRLDVMLVDMNMEFDPQANGLTGGDVAIEISSKLKWPPEALIVSAQNTRVDYYQTALRLRAASYLYKGAAPQAVIIQHVRALAVRHALVGGLELEDRVAAIAQSSRTQAEAVEAFCREILAPELKSCLGTPFVILVTDEGETRKCGGDDLLPDGARDIYGLIQSLTYADTNLSKPLPIDASLLPATSGEGEDETDSIRRRLIGAAFLPLSVNRDLRLSIGILQAGELRDRYPLAENPHTFATVLAGYLRPAVLEHLLTLLARLTEVNAERKTVLRETSKFCLYIGQEQLAILGDALEAGEVKSDSGFFRKLKTLATDLRNTGELLLPLASEEEPQAQQPPERAKTVPVAEAIKAAWDEVKEHFNVEDTALDVRLDDVYEVEAERDDLVLAISRVLQWGVQRPPEGSAPALTVSVEQQAGRHAEIIFEDRSRRLSKHLRELLFEPFTQRTPTPAFNSQAAEPPEAQKPRAGLYLPLYLAKMWVEMKCHGRLDDESDVMMGHVGHRFVMNLPASGKARAADRTH